jgi:hypothetical protein
MSAMAMTTTLFSLNPSTLRERWCTADVCIPVWGVVSAIATLVFFGTLIWAISQGDIPATITCAVGLISGLVSFVSAVAYRFFRPLVHNY